MQEHPFAHLLNVEWVQREIDAEGFQVLQH
jgi:hypothetical protein